MPPNPLVSIVTPCLNAGQFLDATIRSVLSQDYPNVEYIVMDGGSTDGTLAILDHYRDRLQFVSQPDRGTADAINRGFERSRGAILAWLSADDTYLPGAIRAAVERLVAEPQSAAVYGEGYWSDEDGRVLGRYPTVIPYSPAMFRRECPICQPACFMRREAVESVGRLDGTLHSAFDYDLWIRLSERYPFTSVAQPWATSRMHRGNKSLGQKRLMFEESIALLRKHYGYVPVNWVFGYVSFERDGADQFFEPLRPSPIAYWHSLMVGSRYNRGHLLRYWGEWLSRVRFRNLVRGLQRS